MEKLELLPALDIRAGEAVRLIQGDLSQQAKYGSALDVALEFQRRAGALASSDLVHGKRILLKQQFSPLFSV